MMTIENLQKQLIDHKLDAYIITRNNMFLGQDIKETENKILELSGFSGSAGNLIVFRDKAVLLVDGRYDIQAKEQTKDKNIEVVCTRESVGTWIYNNVENPCKFGYDAWCHSISEVDYWKRALARHEFIIDRDNLLGNRIDETQAEIFELEEKYAGVSSEEKISYLTKFCLENQLDGYLICESDCVSWLLNLRSNLIKDTPILRAYALVSSLGEVSLFVNDFEQLEKELENYKGKNIGIAYNKTPKKIQSILKDKRVWIKNYNNPISEWKSIKNEVEIQGFKKAHIYDAIAVIKFLYWLENNYKNTDELGVVNKLYELRKQQQSFYDLSFETIAAYGKNGAIVHYQPTKETNAKLEEGSVLLVDSGGQYLCGTTDITRTVALGKVDDEIKDSFTQVLKAHIAVAKQKFPEGTSGNMLDTLARAELWQYGKTFAHGTGHGVGHFLAVHEGPQSLSLRGNAILKKNMTSSIEPGYYKEGAYGIRIENMDLIVEAEKYDDLQMLKFEPLTMVPMDKSLINKDLLTKEEIKWLNDYHKQVFETMAIKFEGKELDWLKKACEAI